MTTPNTTLNRQRIQSLIARCAEPGQTDRELLQRFTVERDQSAFDALLHRHGPMVLATGRRLLGNAQDAEDVCQATFLLLAERASRQTWQPSVASWLHRTAHLLALKVRRSRARRARREGCAPERTPAPPLAELTARELLAILDEELLGLPESLRAPLVLCYLEGLTRDEAAGRVGCPLGTLKKRLERGRAYLHARLVRRGVGLSAGLLGTLLAGQSAPALSSPLMQATATAALALAAGELPAGMIGPRVVQLLKGGAGMMGWNKIKALFGLLCLGGALTAAALAAAHAENPPPPPAGDTKPDKPPAPPAQAAGAMRVRVLDPQGKPLPGANVHSSIWTDEKGFKANQDVETDADGIAVVKLPKSFDILRLWAKKEPFVELHAPWEQAELSSGSGVPAEYTFRMESPVPAGGRVIDEKGKPVAGAEVSIRTADGGGAKLVGGDGRVCIHWNDTTKTDADGRWHITTLPNHPSTTLQIRVNHPDYVANTRSVAARDVSLAANALRKETATFTLASGIKVHGRVTDPDGKPIKAASVRLGDDPHAWPDTRFATDAEGRFRLPPMAAGGKTSLMVLAPGWAPQYRPIEVKAGLPAQEFRMAAGKLVRLRFVDPTGKPVPKVRVWLEEWMGNRSIHSGSDEVPETGIPRRTDADGVWTWTAAPAEPVKVSADVDGYARMQFEVTGGVADRTVKLRPWYPIRGTVVDATTGKPIPAFTVIPVRVFSKDHLSAARFDAVRGTNGRLEFRAYRTDYPYRLRVEALGYRTQDGPEFRVGEGGADEQDFRLTPSRPITGVVIGATGRPAVKAAVTLVTPSEQASNSDWGNRRTFTDAAGRFVFPDPGEPWAVIARTSDATAFAEFPADRLDAGSLQLRPWASVRGTFTEGGKPVRGARVYVRPIRLEGFDRPRLNATLETRTDPDGRFEFAQVPPGPVCVRIGLGPWREEGFRSAPGVPLDLKPGEKANLTLGSSGAILSGRVKLTGSVPAGLDCQYSINHLVRREPGITPPPAIAAAGFDVRKGWQDAWQNSFEGLSYFSTLRSWFVKLAPDGTFSVGGVPPGEYDLAIAIYAKPQGCLVDPLARKVVRVTVTAEDVKRGELKVPEVSAEVEPIPAVGDTPALKFQRADGKDGTLADCREKYTVVHFWASWCLPCKKQAPALKKLHETFGPRGLAVLSLSLDDNADAWKEALKGLELPWAQGRLGARTPGGVSGVPAYWLLDPSGKLVATASHPDELAADLEKRLKQAP